MANGGRAQVADRANWNNPGARQDYMSNRMENRTERADNLQDRMSTRQDQRQDRRGDFQDNRGDRLENREDFRENFWDNAHDMAHDHWHDDFGDWWDHMWEYHPVGAALGITAWGVNRLSYWFGYGGGYSNPYYSEGGGGGSYDYSQPLETYEQATAPAETVAQPAESASQPASNPVTDLFNAAQTAFYSGDYAGALKSVNDAIALAKNDSVLHEFRSLVLFAQGKYQDSAATIHPVLAVGPGWDWTTLISLYPSVDVYTQQLRKLEEAVKGAPNDASLHFLLAYHYITTSANDPAIHQLQEVVRLQPKDTVAVQLIEMLGGQAALPSQLQQSGPPPAPSAVRLNDSDLIGNWKASSGNSKFELKLTDKKTFSWTYDDKGKTTTVEGVYAVDGNTLAMEPDAGGTMAAELTKLTGSGFHFAVVGAPPGDKGLDFKKG